MRKIEAVLFDIGDVLLPRRNPIAVWEDLILDEHLRDQMLTTIGFEGWSAECDKGLLSDCIAEKIKRFPQEASLIQSFADRWIKTPWAPFDVETVKRVKLLRSLRYKLYIASNWAADDFERARPSMPFLQYFDGMQISGHVHLTKPDPEFFYKMMKKFNFESEDALFIDDQESNIDAAHALGFEVIHFQSAEQLDRELTRLDIFR